jgi:hypothetical protein
MQHEKEANAEKMRQKQAAGMSNNSNTYNEYPIMTTTSQYTILFINEGETTNTVS